MDGARLAAMARRNLNDLLAFVTVAREGSFTRAAAALGVTQSALSQTVRALEERLQIRLLTRTTRSVSPTAAGERLMQAIGHRFDEIEAELDALTALRDKPGGTVRITCGDYMLQSTLLPRLAPLLLAYPDICMEFDVYYGFRDIVAERFDAGVRLGSTRSEEHTSELQSHLNLVCRLLLEKTKVSSPPGHATRPPMPRRNACGSLRRPRQHRACPKG